MSNTTWYEYRSFRIFHDDSPLEGWSPIDGEDDKLREFLAKQGWEADPTCADNGSCVFVRRPFELVPQVSDEMADLQGRMKTLSEWVGSLQETIAGHGTEVLAWRAREKKLQSRIDGLERGEEDHRGSINYFTSILGQQRKALHLHAETDVQGAQPVEQVGHKTRFVVDSVEDAISEWIGGNVAWELTVKGGVEWK